MKNNKHYNKNHCTESGKPKTPLPSSEAAPSRVVKNRSVWANYNGAPCATARNTGADSRHRLETDGSQQEMLDAVIAPRTASEKLMASIWEEILNLKQISVHANFFDHGRDSYSAMEIVTRVRKVFAVSLSVRALFEDPTVAGMTTAVLKSQHLQHQNPSSVKASSERGIARKQALQLLLKAK